MARILLVDDDPHIREVVRFALERAGHAVSEARDGAEALERHEREQPDLLVLDIVMPEDDGLSVCRTIRAKAPTPIIFISSRAEELDRVLGLEMGGDDYLTKPFSPRELVARVAAVLRRAAPRKPDESREETLRHGPLELDPVRHRATCDGKELVLTVTEFGLLQVLLGQPGRVFERAQLGSGTYGADHYVSDRTVDSHMRRLRSKLGEHAALVETVYGVGYRLAEDLP